MKNIESGMLKKDLTKECPFYVMFQIFIYLFFYVMVRFSEWCLHLSSDLPLSFEVVLHKTWTMIDPFLVELWFH